MILKTPRQLADMLITAGIASSDTVLGCTPSDVLNIEQHFQIKLPESYKSFLLTMGRQAGEFNDDFYFLVESIEDLISMRENAESVIREFAGYELKQSDFVFLARYSVTFLWFDTAAGPEPPVMLMEDGADEVRELAPTFLDWLNTDVAYELEYAAEAASSSS